VKFDIDLGMPTRTSQRRPENPFKVLVMGDFAGTPYCLHRVDLDSFDTVMKSMAPRVGIQAASLGDSQLRLEFTSLEDFHPDALFRCGIFQALRDQRARLADPATFREAADALLDVSREGSSPARTDGDLLERLLGSRSRELPAATKHGGVIQRLINSVVAPHIVPDLAPQQNRYLASVDEAIGALMREILHAPAFQSHEGLWRSVRALLDETEGSEDVEIWLFDAAARNLKDEMTRWAEDPTRSQFFDIVVGRAERAPDAEPWSIVIGNYLFGANESDIDLLTMLGATCRRAGALFIAGADPGLAGCDSFAVNPDPDSWTPARAGHWAALRSKPFASSVALAAPRNQLRLPYGKSTDAIDSFAFEELSADDGHESLLWGNSAFVLGRLMIRGFLASGWDADPADELELTGLPALTRGARDDRKLQACAEAYLSQRAGEKLLSLGLVPLLSYEQRPAIRVMRMQSIAEPAASLDAAWT
jgi:type VI secretion system protein ImpC